MSGGEIAAVVLAGVAAVSLVCIGLMSRDRCQESPDGVHEDITVRTPDGFCRQCIRCTRLTKGIAAFSRPEAK
jgi:hypothetical protein